MRQNGRKTPPQRQTQKAGTMKAANDTSAFEAEFEPVRPYYDCTRSGVYYCTLKPTKTAASSKNRPCACPTKSN